MPRELKPTHDWLGATAVAWAAGFFEGEGSFYPHRFRPRADGSQLLHVYAGATQKDEQTIRRFHDIVGIGTVLYVARGDIFSWKTTRKGQAAQVLDKFRPWLSDRRINRAEELLLIENTQRMRGRSAA